MNAALNLFSQCPSLVDDKYFHKIILASQISKLILQFRSCSTRLVHYLSKFIQDFRAKQLHIIFYGGKMILPLHMFQAGCHAIGLGFVTFQEIYCPVLQKGCRNQERFKYFI